MTYSIPRGPQKIVCLTEEPTEILYLLGEDHRIAGISAYTVRPPEAKKTKPVVSAFIDGNVRKIKALEPDLVIGFSDIQADLASKLIAENLQVLIFNQRTIQEIFDVIRDIGAIVGKENEALTLVSTYIKRIETLQTKSKKRQYRPDVYFEEWNDPPISCIQWVSELIDIAGARDVFAEKSLQRHAKNRIISGEDIKAADPDIFIASWCGKTFDRESAEKRLNDLGVKAAKNKAIYDMPSEIILQPGPACLTAGLDRLVQICNNHMRS